MLSQRPSELAEELQKTILRKINSPFIDSIWSVDLVDMQLISKYNKGNRFLLEP